MDKASTEQAAKRVGKGDKKKAYRRLWVILAPLAGEQRGQPVTETEEADRLEKSSSPLT